MNKICPNPDCAFPQNIIKDGHFKRKEDSKYVQRFRCNNCKTRFSNATFSECYKQKKRRINSTVLRLLSSGVSMRRIALVLNVDKKTIERKLPFLAMRCRRLNKQYLNKMRGRVHNIQIDDLITKENSKLKPLAVTIAVDESRRMILALEVSKIPSFGIFSKFAVKKYGYRKDEHTEGLKKVFQTISEIASPEVLVKSDEHNRYPAFVSTYFPRGKHLTFKSTRATVAGQGELRVKSFDPLFIINHTCAILRANVNRLIRKTWCTTKDPDKLKDHLDIFMYYYNVEYLRKTLTPL